MAITAKTTKNTADELKNNAPKAPPTLFGEPQEELEDEEIDELVRDPDEFDIFSDVGEKMTKAGDRITYTIKRNGEFIAGSVAHPYSWDHVQKKWGGGTFQVIARSTNRGGYVKSQTRNVAGPDLEEVDHGGGKEKGSSVTELLAIMQQQTRAEREEQRLQEERRDNERREREERERRDREKQEADKKSSETTMLTMMMQMMQAQSQQTTALLTAMMGGKKEDIKIEKILELMDSRMEKTISQLTGKSKDRDSLDPIKVMEMTANAEERGYKRAMDAVELAEKKAEELADMRERGGGSSQEKEPSTTKALVDAVMPVMQSFMAIKGEQAAAAAVAASSGAPGHRPALPAPANPKTIPLARGPAASAAALGLGKAPVAQRKPAPVQNPQKVLIENTVVAEIGKDLSANLLSQKFNPEKTAENSLDLLAKHGITAQVLCSQYSLDDMIKFAKARGMPDALNPYLEKFYAHIKAKASVGSGEPAPSSEPGNQ